MDHGSQGRNRKPGPEPAAYRADHAILFMRIDMAEDDRPTWFHAGVAVARALSKRAVLDRQR